MLILGYSEHGQGYSRSQDPPGSHPLLLESGYLPGLHGRAAVAGWARPVPDLWEQPCDVPGGLPALEVRQQASAPAVFLQGEPDLRGFAARAGEVASGALDAR